MVTLSVLLGRLLVPQSVPPSMPAPTAADHRAWIDAIVLERRGAWPFHQRKEQPAPSPLGIVLQLAATAERR